MIDMNGSESEDGEHNELSGSLRVCPYCGLDAKGFEKSGRFGCPLDYDIFSVEIDSVFLSTQAASMHVGKWPKRGPSRFEVLKLQSEMRLAIQRQDYESAASIRDRLRDRNQFRES